jgi:hypothetical protein
MGGVSKILGVITMVLILTAGQNTLAQAEVKFNAATAVLLVPNFGVELSIAPHYSAQMDVLGSFWDSVGEDRDPYQINETFVEGRYYQNPDQSGWYTGAHVGFGMFTLQKVNAFVIYDQYQDPDTYSDAPGSFQSGRAGFYGLSFGYKKRLDDRWALEAFIGGGLVQSNYKGYSGFMRVDVLPGDTREFNKSGEWALYRGGLMITYSLFTPKSNKS